MVPTGRRAAAAAGLAGLLLIAGCSVQPGVAATVDGRTISQSQLESAVADLNQIAEVDPTALLRIMVLAPILIEGAQANGVGVSEAEARTSLEESWVAAEQARLDEQAAAAGVDGEAVDDGEAQPVGDVPEFGREAIQVRRFEISASKLEQHPDAQEIFGELGARAQGLDVDLNPRYGTFDPATLAIAPVTSPWIVTTAP